MGALKAAELDRGNVEAFDKGVYFIGKVRDVQEVSGGGHDAATIIHSHFCLPRPTELCTSRRPDPHQVLWAKGYTELLDRMKEHNSRTGQNVHVDVYGSGPDLKVWRV